MPVECIPRFLSAVLSVKSLSGGGPFLRIHGS